MNKKILIIIIFAGFISFGVTFFVGLKTTKPPEVRSDVNQPHDVNAAGLKIAQPQIPAPSQSGTVSQNTAMTEKQLRELIYEVREKINEYDYKMKEIELRERNIQTARDNLKKDVNELENLRIELTSTIAAIKSEQEKLSRTMLEISKTEEANLKLIAASYDKMDAAQAGKILASMNQAKGGNSDDAVKILYYMAERTKAKVLAAIAETEPAVSANFCQRLKKISVKD